MVIEELGRVSGPGAVVDVGRRDEGSVAARAVVYLRYRLDSDLKDLVDLDRMHRPRARAIEGVTADLLRPIQDMRSKPCDEKWV